MPKDEWGVKRVCPSCQGRFYDLQNEEMVCPYCEHTFNLSNLNEKPKLEKPEDKEKPDEAEDVASEADGVLDEEDADIDVEDDLLDDDDDDNVSLEEIKDVASEDDDS